MSLIRTYIFHDDTHPINNSDLIIEVLSVKQTTQVTTSYVEHVSSVSQLLSFVVTTGVPRVLGHETTPVSVQLLVSYDTFTKLFPSYPGPPRVSSRPVPSEPQPLGLDLELFVRP